MTAPTVDIRRADDRAKTRISWLDSKHSFSFGSHYEPDNTHHGLLLVNNDDIVEPGTGFDTHPHRDMEIVTWVLRGSLVHQDSIGHSGVIYPGLAQRMSAGRGILHSEKNDSRTLTGGQSHGGRSPPATRLCTARGCSQATSSNCRRPRICTCSSRAVKSHSRAQDRCAKAMRCGSPHPAVNASPPPNPQRFWFGRCMRVWPRRKRIGAALIGVVLIAACS